MTLNPARCEAGKAGIDRPARAGRLVSRAAGVRVRSSCIAVSARFYVDMPTVRPLPRVLCSCI